MPGYSRRQCYRGTSHVVSHVQPISVALRSPTNALRKQTKQTHSAKSFSGPKPRTAFLGACVPQYVRLRGMSVLRQRGMPAPRRRLDPSRSEDPPAFLAGVQTTTSLHSIWSSKIRHLPISSSPNNKPFGTKRRPRLPSLLGEKRKPDSGKKNLGMRKRSAGETDAQVNQKKLTRARARAGLAHFFVRERVSRGRDAFSRASSRLRSDLKRLLLLVRSEPEAIDLFFSDAAAIGRQNGEAAETKARASRPHYAVQRSRALFFLRGFSFLTWLPRVAHALQSRAS